MRPRRLIPKRFETASYLVLAAIGVIGGGAAIGLLGTTWWATMLTAAVAAGAVVGSCALLTRYWRNRNTEIWIAEAFPSDSERDVQMRHDLMHGSPLCK